MDCKENMKAAAIYDPSGFGLCLLAPSFSLELLTPFVTLLFYSLLGVLGDVNVRISKRTSDCASIVHASSLSSLFPSTSVCASVCPRGITIGHGTREGAPYRVSRVASKACPSFPTLDFPLASLERWERVNPPPSHLDIRCATGPGV